jgi:hypothetical protein
MSTKLKNSDKISFDQFLQQELCFTEADLELNKQGQISLSQREILERKRRDISLSGWGCAVLYLILVSITGIWVGHQLESAYELIVVGALLAGCGITILEAFFRHQHITQDLAKAEVLSTTGLIKRYMFRSSTEIHVNGKQLSISANLYHALTDGEPYTLYFVPASTTLLSAEYWGEKQTLTPDEPI